MFNLLCAILLCAILLSCYVRFGLSYFIGVIQIGDGSLELSSFIHCMEWMFR